MSLKWDDLRYFIAVAKAGNLTAAAQLVGASQPTVSRRIRALEQELDAKLLRRVDDKYSPTPLGEQVLELAARMEQSAFTIERLSSGAQERVEGTVRIATTECIASNWLVEQVPTLTECYPNLEIQILTDNRYSDLTRKEADLAIRIGVAGAQGLHCELVGNVQFDLYASLTYLKKYGQPESFDDLGEHLGIDSLREISGVPQAVAFREAMPGALPVAFNSILSQLRGVQAALGMMVLPKHLCVNDNRLQQLMPEHFRSQRDLWLIMHPDLSNTARFTATWDFLNQALRKDALTFTD